MLLFEEHRENDPINDALIQLLTDLLPEELLNEARHLCSLSRGLSIFDDYLLYQIKFVNKKICEQKNAFVEKVFVAMNGIRTRAV